MKGFPPHIPPAGFEAPAKSKEAPEQDWRNAPAYYDEDPNKVSFKQAFIRYFLPGWASRWTEKQPNVAKLSLFRRIFLPNFAKVIHTLLAILIPVILLLPVIEPFRYKVDTGNQSEYFAVSLYHTWIGPDSDA